MKRMWKFTHPYHLARRPSAAPCTFMWICNARTTTSQISIQWQGYVWEASRLGVPVPSFWTAGNLENSSDSNLQAIPMTTFACENCESAESSGKPSTVIRHSALATRSTYSTRASDRTQRKWVYCLPLTFGNSRVTRSDVHRPPFAITQNAS